MFGVSIGMGMGVGVGGETRVVEAARGRYSGRHRYDGRGCWSRSVGRGEARARGGHKTEGWE